MAGSVQALENSLPLRENLGTTQHPPWKHNWLNCLPLGPQGPESLNPGSEDTLLGWNSASDNECVTVGVSFAFSASISPWVRKTWQQLSEGVGEAIWSLRAKHLVSTQWMGTKVSLYLGRLCFENQTIFYSNYASNGHFLQKISTEDPLNAI